MKTALALVVLTLAACSDVDLHNNPAREVSKQEGPLTVPPAGLRAGTSR